MRISPLLVYAVCVAFSSINLPAGAQLPILSQREQARVIDDILQERILTVLPALMRREGIDMWVMISREYNEDPVLRTFLPSSWMAARRTTMLLIYDRGVKQELECLAVARYDVGTIFKQSWDPGMQPDQWAQLARLIEERNPKKIGVNKSLHFGHADGLSATDYEKLMSLLHKKFASHVTSAEKLAVSWLETRSETEMAVYPKLCKIAHDIIKEGFSPAVIHAGITTTEDVEWWYRERIKELRLDTWFHPHVTLQRDESESTLAKRPKPLVIMPGDLLHVDFGITYLRLNTDTQQHAYVLRPGETTAPEFLKNALTRGNKLQDILTRNFAAGKTGNQILEESRKQAKDQNLTPSIYTHPLGYHVHGAGPTIGLWDQQEGVPHTGDYPMHYNTAYSIELNVTIYSIEWKKEIKIMLEEDGYFDESGFRYLDGRQTELILIR